MLLCVHAFGVRIVKSRSDFSLYGRPAFLFVGCFVVVLPCRERAPPRWPRARVTGLLSRLAPLCAVKAYLWPLPAHNIVRLSGALYPSLILRGPVSTP